MKKRCESKKKILKHIKKFKVRVHKSLKHARINYLNKKGYSSINDELNKILQSKKVSISKSTSEYQSIDTKLMRSLFNIGESHRKELICCVCLDTENIATTTDKSSNNTNNTNSTNNTGIKRNTRKNVKSKIYQCNKCNEYVHEKCYVSMKLVSEETIQAFTNQ